MKLTIIRFQVRRFAMSRPTLQLPDYEVSCLGAYLIDPSKATKAGAIAELEQLTQQATQAALNEAQQKARVRVREQGGDEEDAARKARPDSDALQRHLEPLMNAKYVNLRYQILDAQKLGFLDALCAKLIVQESGASLIVGVLYGEAAQAAQVSLTYYDENNDGYLDRLAGDFSRQQTAAIDGLQAWAKERFIVPLDG